MGQGRGPSRTEAKPSSGDTWGWEGASPALGTGPRFLHTSCTPLCSALESESGWAAAHWPAGSVAGTWLHRLWPLPPALCLTLSIISHIFLFGRLTLSIRALEDSDFCPPATCMCGAAPVCFPQQPGHGSACPDNQSHALSGAAPFHPPLSSGSLAVSSNLPLIQKDAK